MAKNNFELPSSLRGRNSTADNLRYDHYWKAIKCAVKKGDVVADLGSESGILTFFALKAGAKKVYAIYDTSYEGIKKLIRGLNPGSAEVILIDPNSSDKIKEPLDVMISSAKGALGFDEHSLNKITKIRDQYLKVDGVLIPEDLTLWLSPVESDTQVSNKIIWSHIHAFDFSSSQQASNKKVVSQLISKKSLLAKPQMLANIDFYTETRSVIQKKLTFEAFRAGMMNGFAGWYQVNLFDGISYSTSPDSSATFGVQSFIPLENNITIFKDQCFGAEFTIEAPRSNEGSSCTSFKLFEHKPDETPPTPDEF